MRTTTQQYDLLELAGVDPEIATILTTGDDFQELEAVRDAMQADSIGIKGPDSMTLQRFAVRPSLGPGQVEGMRWRGGTDERTMHDLVPFAKFA